MNLRFPLKDVILREVPAARMVENPDYADEFWQMNMNEFAMKVEGVGSFYACNGNEVEYSLCSASSPRDAELYLNGSVYGAILHQRHILPLHGSSFIHSEKGVMICGDTGSGKSSVTAAFVLARAEFLTDDVTPVVFRDTRPCVLALSDRIKLWDNTLEQLKLQKNGLGRIAPGTEKFYYPFENGKREFFPLNMVFILNVSDNSEIVLTEITGAGKAAVLRNEIYRPEYLKGMKENEEIFFHQILEVSRNIRVVSVCRPKDIAIEELRSGIECCIAEM